MLLFDHVCLASPALPAKVGYATSRKIATFGETCLNRDTICQLSVFQGSFDFTAAAAVLAATADISELWLGQLRRGSLLEWDTELARYRLHDLVREFAAARLADSPAVRWRHANYFLQLAEQARGETHAAGHISWLEKIECEHTNVRQALDWLSQQNDVTPELRLATALGSFWIGRDHLGEGIERLQAALARTTAGYEKLHAQALAHLGALYRVQGRLEASRSAYEQSRVLFQRREDEQGYADVMFKLGLVISDQSEKLAARAYFEASLAYFRRHGQPAQAAAALSNLGRTALDAVDYAAAQHYYTESSSLMRAASPTEELGWLMVNLARLASIQNDHPLALEHIEEGLDYFSKLGHSQGHAWALLRKGDILTIQADFAAARSCLSETLARFEKLSNTVGCAMAFHSLSRTALAHGDQENAWPYARSCLQLFYTLQNKPGIGMGVELIARMLVAWDGPTHHTVIWGQRGAA